jgi:hypothetical protein
MHLIKKSPSGAHLRKLKKKTKSFCVKCEAKRKATEICGFLCCLEDSDSIKPMRKEFAEFQIVRSSVCS